MKFRKEMYSKGPVINLQEKAADTGQIEPVPVIKTVHPVLSSFVLLAYMVFSIVFPVVGSSYIVCKVIESEGIIEYLMNHFGKSAILAMFILAVATFVVTLFILYDLFNSALMLIHSTVKKAMQSKQVSNG